MSLELYAAYLVACLIVVIVPGPTVTLILANSLTPWHARRADQRAGHADSGSAIMIGIVGDRADVVDRGDGPLVRLAADGRRGLLGVARLEDDPRLGESADGQPARSPRGGFVMQGALVALSNPKTLLFFGAFFPQFIDPARDHGLQILIMGLTAMLFAAVSDSAYALASGRAGRVLSARRVRLLSRVSGGFLIGGGVWLALSRR